MKLDKFRKKSKSGQKTRNLFLEHNRYYLYNTTELALNPQRAIGKSCQ